ncbi:uncharacterized protein LOC114343505 [Diabrotica virgifera virgifera]|uniref:Uncharacterized protein LOC114343505 n=1 Tax=Diabrotica virgifera virgifera TaxID=50390 RepID=A0A6P7GXJ8_DIAVI|nr:uncharacterized protein LOC114343505 [Diabrotica virgifera virgifera]
MNDDAVDLLISAVQKRRALWDKRNENYTDNKVRETLWKEVATERNITDYKKARSKWRDLKHVFSDKLKRGSESEHKWKWFEKLRFLEETIQEESQRITDGGGISGPQSPTGVSIPSAASTSLNLSESRKRRYIAAEEGEGLNTGIEKFDLNKSIARKEDEDDPTSRFLMDLKDSIDSLPKHSQMFVKSKILQIIAEEIEKKSETQ